ncbi:MAG: VacJ family lipoprotein [Caulobacteraceae bacterium]|nr:VacJ family lipoprotein [Caulobacteraceae bacterium]
MRKAFIAAFAAVAFVVAGPALAQDAAASAQAQVQPTADAGLPYDPAEKINRVSFAIHQTLDHYLFRPAALAYKAATPKFVRLGLEHVLSNLGEPVVVVNDVLQGRFKKAAVASTRFVVNSTVGLAGLIDVGAKNGLPHHDNGFAMTLGRAGVGPGPYLFIPFVGPTTIRDVVGTGVDIITDPFHWLVHDESNTIIVGTAVVEGLDARANADADLKALLSNATDPYATLRSVYLQNDQSKIEDRPEDAVPALPDFDEGAPPSFSSPTVPAPARPPPATPPVGPSSAPPDSPASPAPAPTSPAPAQPPPGA